MRNQKLLYLIALSFLFSLATKGQPKQGDPASEIALPSVTGDTIKLSSLKGKIVLLDFWASWCGPCRYTNKNLVKLYSKYKSKGFEIYSVSLDEHQQQWKNAIKKDKIEWLQVNEGGGWEAKTAQAWNISALPTSFLIDRDGKLLAMDLEGKELEKALKYMIDK